MTHQRSGPAAHRMRRRVLVQFVKFGIVGISNTLLTFIVYTILLKGFGVWYLAGLGDRLHRAARRTGSCSTADGRSASTSATR